MCRRGAWSWRAGWGFTVPAASQAAAPLGQVLFGCSWEGEGGARSAQTPEPVLLREHLPGCSSIGAAEQKLPLQCSWEGRAALPHCPPCCWGNNTL